MSFDGICQDFETLSEDLGNAIVGSCEEADISVPQIVSSMDGLANEIARYLNVPPNSPTRLIKPLLENTL